LWLLHQYRQAYDLSGTNLTNLSGDQRSEEIRNYIVSADNACFASCRRIFVNSRVTQARLEKYNGFSSTILLPPLKAAEDFQCKGYGDYIFAGGRINLMKRQHLLVEAMSRVPKGCRLIVAGPPDSPADGERLEKLVSEHQLQERVVLDLGWITRERLASYVNGALACAYLPVDEESVGYVTMEAFYASKSVITGVDSGGILDLVTDHKTGMVVEPNHEAIAMAMTQLTSDRAETERMGANARDAIDRMSPVWKTTIDRLLA
jgi:glycosyltransferase involved in cell wall biosynthesis